MRCRVRRRLLRSVCRGRRRLGFHAVICAYGLNQLWPGARFFDLCLILRGELKIDAPLLHVLNQLLLGEPFEPQGLDQSSLANGLGSWCLHSESERDASHQNCGCSACCQIVHVHVSNTPKSFLVNEDRVLFRRRDAAQPPPGGVRARDRQCPVRLKHAHLAARSSAPAPPLSPAGQAPAWPLDAAWDAAPLAALAAVLIPPPVYSAAIQRAPVLQSPRWRATPRLRHNISSWTRESPPLSISGVGNSPAAPVEHPRASSLSAPARRV